MTDTDPEERAKLANLVEWSKTMAKAEELAGAPMFLGIPDRWFEAWTWRCINDHVSNSVLKSEQRGDLCLAAGCHARGTITFPEDRDGPRRGCVP